MSDDSIPTAYIWSHRCFYQPSLDDVLPIYVPPTPDPWEELCHGVCLEAAYREPRVFSAEQYGDRKDFIAMLTEGRDE